MFDLKQENLMNHCSIQLWYNKQRIKKNGSVTLYLQICIGHETTEVKLPLSWPVNYFDWEKRIITPQSANDPDYNTFTAYIIREQDKYWKVVRSFLNENRNFTLSDLFKEINYFRSGHTFMEFMSQQIRERQKLTKNIKFKIKPSTARTHKSTLERVDEFLNKLDIPITSIDDKWLDAFSEHLQKTMTHSSAWVKIQNVKSYLGYAEHLKIAVNKDYKLFSMNLEDDEAEFLEESELSLLFKLYEKRTLPPDLTQTLRSFLFACVTGLRISDLKRWSKQWIKGNSIVFVPTKVRISVRNPKPVVIPIMPMAQRFINELKGDNMGIISDVLYNRQLKIIAIRAGVYKRVTSHVARHTFGTWMRMAGVPEIVLSKIMGHKKVETTRKYTHIAEGIKARAIMMGEGQFQKFNQSRSDKRPARRIGAD